jgi:STE24 endopeptidase
MVWLAPTYIMPIFNRFTPMADGDLKQSIEELGKQCQFPLNGVFVMDGSRRSTKANAFFTGIGKHKKIALFDTLIETCPKPEIMAVLAHEIGHFRCGHIRSRLIAGMFHLGALCFLLGICTDASSNIARALFDAFGVRTISPHVGLVLFGILMTPLSTVIAIVLNAWSRKHEFEADAFARKAVGSGSPLADALRRMTMDHLAHPSPSRLRVWLDHSHPPLLKRLQALEPSTTRGG